jgi:hypothetical protein
LSRHVSLATGILVSVLGAFGLFLLGLVLTGKMWRALAYATVALFGFLVVQAILFWGAVLLGSLVEVVARRRNPVSWSIGGSSRMDAPEHDLDPGLQLLAAGMLVYHLGEVTPRVHFRRVPLAGARSMRPFVVARTGSSRPYRFEFVLSDERGIGRFRDEFAFDLRDDPQIVLPCCRLALSMPRRLVGQRWSLRVRSGVTTVTSFRFTFVDGGGHPNGMAVAWEESIVGWQQELLPGLLDEALKRDMLTSTREIVLEDV